MKTSPLIATAVAGVVATSFFAVCAQPLPREGVPLSPSPDSVQAALLRPLRSGEAYVWYLLHCGYAVKTATKLLVFDYVRTTRDATVPPGIQSLATGTINPAELRNLDVYVFVTHSHEDHYDPVIFDWQRELKRLTYIFGWKVADGPRNHSLVAPRDSLQIGGMSVYTISCWSGVREVAYLIKTDGLTMFFLGDYKSDALTDIEYVLGKCDVVDMVFVGATTKRWPVAADRIARVTERIRPRVVFPMHSGGQEATYRVFAREFAERGLSFPINCPQKPGDRFSYVR